MLSQVTNRVGDDAGGAVINRVAVLSDVHAVLPALTGDIANPTGRGAPQTPVRSWRTHWRIGQTHDDAVAGDKPRG
jgi:hypothetical protein